MSGYFYILFIRLYALAAQIISPFNKKAKLWVEGRRDIFSVIERSLSGGKKHRIWIHCSSLGEFEQARPLITAFKKNYPSYSIVLTFFSPSGYEHAKRYAQVGHIFYMPLDSKSNACHFFELVQPKLVMFVKYEFWNFYLREAKRRDIPLLLASAVFRENQPFFKWYGDFHRQMLNCFSWIFVQNEVSFGLLKKIGIQNLSISGDTRFDRVMEVADNFEPINNIDNFCAGKTVIVAGSTWLEDDEELNHLANAHPDLRFIIAPHEIDESRLKECEKLYHFSIRYSNFVRQLDKVEVPTFDIQNRTANTLIIDNIGMLKYLYRYANVGYVGGGFGGDGVHNVLEAAVYGKPVIFGPVYEKYAEAVELEKEGGAFSVNSAVELEETIKALLLDSRMYNAAARSARDYVRSRIGATDNIMGYIQEKRLLTN